ncbi:Protein kinase [Actinidia chinensis var. chinensis]|uniref:Protein kinase n=1 Tax=Actinidia chinensis var. chinensis TaxID=1590841 RepID=A0A2R6QIH2_ACTCC|nr:Protein kinase [Actinidia chinensis var. chinensis]
MFITISSMYLNFVDIAHYDYKSQGTISANDFALSMVASADMSHINKFLDRVEELNDEPYLGDMCFFRRIQEFFRTSNKITAPISCNVQSPGSEWDVDKARYTKSCPPSMFSTVSFDSYFKLSFS